MSALREVAGELDDGEGRGEAEGLRRNPVTEPQNEHRAQDISALCRVLMRRGGKHRGTEDTERDGRR